MTAITGCGEFLSVNNQVVYINNQTNDNHSLCECKPQIVILLIFLAERKKKKKKNPFILWSSVVCIESVIDVFLPFLYSASEHSYDSLLTTTTILEKKKKGRGAVSHGLMTVCGTQRRNSPEIKIGKKNGGTWCFSLFPVELRTIHDARRR